MKHLALTSLLVLLTTSPATAADVTVKNVHLCCGACVSAVDDALSDIDGVTKVAADRNTKVVSFTAANEKASAAGLQALSDAGFYGNATIDGKKTAYPGDNPKPGTMRSSVSLYGVHLCCGSCVKSAHEAVKDVKGVSTVKVDRSTETVTVEGTKIDVAAALAALRKGGFNATTKKPKDVSSR